MKKIYNIEEFKIMYKYILGEERLSNKKKVYFLKAILTELNQYHCYKENSITCPNSILCSINEDSEEVELLCKYFNFKSSCLKHDNVERILACPINIMESEFNRLLSIFSESEEERIKKSKTLDTIKVEPSIIPIEESAQIVEQVYKEAEDFKLKCLVKSHSVN